MKLRRAERTVLTVLQRGIALQEHPFRGLAMPETDVVCLLQRSYAGGLIRRFGGVFDADRLGYRSTLCAVVAPPGTRHHALAAVLCRHPGVTHCYTRVPVRGGHTYPTLWFTITVPKAAYADELVHLEEQLEGVTWYCLPALQRFKLEVFFDVRDDPDRGQLPVKPAAPAAPAAVADVAPFSACDRRMIRRMSGHLQITADPFATLSDALGMAPTALLSKLQRWQQRGVLRRVAPVLHHRRAGFRYNGMCVWPVEGDVSVAGKLLAAYPEVTHCYQRPRKEACPFDLYAMLHARSQDDLLHRFQTLSEACGLSGGTILLSTRTHKKTSMAYCKATC